MQRVNASSLAVATLGGLFEHPACSPGVISDLDAAVASQGEEWFFNNLLGFHMGWKLAADVMVVAHLLWILFLILGAIVGRRIAWVKWLHIGGLIFSILLQVFGWVCPITYLEVWLRGRHDPSLAYGGDFIAHYAEKLVYLPVSRLTVLALTAVVVALSVWAYWPGRKPA